MFLLKLFQCNFFIHNPIVGLRACTDAIMCGESQTLSTCLLKGRIHEFKANEGHYYLKLSGSKHVPQRSGRKIVMAVHPF